MKRLISAILLISLTVIAGCAKAEADWTSEQELGTVADLGFRPDRDGFSFENFGQSPNGITLSSDDVRELLGTDACEEDETTAESCTLMPRAASFQTDNQGLATGGVCEGMSVAALLFFTSQRDPNQYGGSMAHELQIAGNVELERLLLRANASQLTTETVESLTRAQPVEVLDTLSAAFREGTETYTIGLYNLVDGKLTDGHAVVPYKIEHVGDGIVRLYIYNPNNPNEDQFIVINATEDTWFYQGRATTYDGSAQLELAPMSPRLVENFNPKTLDDFRAQAINTGSRCPAAG